MWVQTWSMNKLAKIIQQIISDHGHEETLFFDFSIAGLRDLGLFSGHKLRAGVAISKDNI